MQAQNTSFGNYLAVWRVHFPTELVSVVIGLLHYVFRRFQGVVQKPESTQA
ncbi:MAG: hypothetical protein JWM11_7047, partial [Planctomycetaceae bacterium]|nr:hypothetical protein [Planctomycetaceae bacterium]